MFSPAVTFGSGLLCVIYTSAKFKCSAIQWAGTRASRFLSPSSGFSAGNVPLQRPYLVHLFTFASSLGWDSLCFPPSSPPPSVLSDFTPSWPTFGLNFWSVSFSGPQRAHSSSLMKPVGGFDLQIGSGLAEMVKINAFLKEICSFSAAWEVCQGLLLRRQREAGYFWCKKSCMEATQRGCLSRILLGLHCLIRLHMNAQNSSGAP